MKDTVVYRITLADTGELVYIGQTSNLSKRMIAHRGPSTGRYHGVAVNVKASKPMHRWDAVDLERDLIRRLQPRDNVVHTARHGATCAQARATWVMGPWGTAGSKVAS